MACFDLPKFLTSWWREGRRLLGRVGVVTLLGVMVWALWCLPPWMVEQELGECHDLSNLELATLKNDYRRTVAQILGGFGLLVGLYLGWRRVRAAEEGQITERFTRAVEQLGQEGKDKMAIRLGGIYALERIAKDSAKDHGPIMEVLTAYVREKAPRLGEGKTQRTFTESPPTDVQALLTVIGRRETTGNNGGNDYLDLINTRLIGANLNGADLAGAQLNGADLFNALLIEANLRGAFLVGADLAGAALMGADLAGTVLIEANLNGTDLSEAKNLTAGQVEAAENWREAHLPDNLQHLLKEPPA